MKHVSYDSLEISPSAVFVSPVSLIDQAHVTHAHRFVQTAPVSSLDGASHRFRHQLAPFCQPFDPGSDLIPHTLTDTIGGVLVWHPQ